MRVALLSLFCAVVLLSVVFEEAESHRISRKFHLSLLRRLYLRRIRGRRPCITQNGCFRNACCVRDITTSDDDTSVTFNKFGVCMDPTDFLNATLFVLNRIDDEIAAATDRAAELAEQSIGQDSLLLCRPGTLGPQTEADSINKRSARPSAQIDAARLVRVVQGPDVATVNMIEPEEEDSGDGSGEGSGESMKRSPLMQFKNQAQEAESLLASLVKELDTIQK